MSHSAIAKKVPDSSLPNGEILASSTNPIDIQLIALQALEADPIFRGRLPLRSIAMVVEGNRLIVSGNLPSYYLKQRLQEVIRRVPGVRDFENLVEVTNR